MGEGVRVRRAKVEDLPALVSLWREFVAYHANLDADAADFFRLAPGANAAWRRIVRDYFGKRKKLCLVAEVDGEAVGFLMAIVRERGATFAERVIGDISHAYVQESRRGKGVGRALTAGALAWFKARGVPLLSLGVGAVNTLGVEFWKRMGFETKVLVMFRKS